MDKQILQLWLKRIVVIVCCCFSTYCTIAIWLLVTIALHSTVILTKMKFDIAAPGWCAQATFKIYFKVNPLWRHVSGGCRICQCLMIFCCYCSKINDTYFTAVNPIFSNYTAVHYACYSYRPLITIRCFYNILDTNSVNRKVVLARQKYCPGVSWRVLIP